MVNDNNCLVSVVIPLYNGAAFLQTTVESVIENAFPDFEILLINDGSTDNSKKICEDLESRYKNISFYSFEKNKGLGNVLNFSLRKAKGKYICRLNQDDLMTPDRLEKQVEFLTKNPEVVVV